MKHGKCGWYWVLSIIKTQRETNPDLKHCKDCSAFKKKKIIACLTSAVSYSTLKKEERNKRGGGQQQKPHTYRLYKITFHVQFRVNRRSWMWQTQLLNKWWRKVCMCMSVWFFFCILFLGGGGENFFKFLFTRCIRARSGRRHFCRRCRPVGSEQSGRPESRCRWSCRSSSRRPSLSWLDGTDPAERQTVFEFTLYANTMIQTFKVGPILTPRWPELSQNCFRLFVSVSVSLSKERIKYSLVKSSTESKAGFPLEQL